MPNKFDTWTWIGVPVTPGSSQPQLPTGQPAGRIKKLQPNGYISVRTLFNDVCTIHEMYVAICTRYISYTNLPYTCLYTVCTCLYDSKYVCKCINMYIHVWTMYIHVYSPNCTYHVRTMYIHVYDYWVLYIPCTYMYIHFMICTYMFKHGTYYSIVYSTYVHGINMYVHVYTRWVGFQM